MAKKEGKEKKMVVAHRALATRSTLPDHTSRLEASNERATQI